ncbi:hypothetical protein GS575_09450 [Rhodococcus hoagii]|nr:hypothetical protein [Prescottella equi]
MTNLERLRVVVDPAESPLSRPDAHESFQSEWKKARRAYVKLLGSVGSPFLTRLLEGGGAPIRPVDVKLAIRDVQEMADATAAINQNLSAVLELWDRVAAHEIEGGRQ